MGWLWRQIVRIRTRLLLINALIAAVPLLGVSFARIYEREMLAAVEADMIHQSQVVGEFVGADHHRRGSMLRRAAHQTTTRLRIINTGGAVVADSAGIVGDDVSARREIRLALAGRYGASTRVIKDRGISVMFVAVPIVRSQAVVGVIYASRSTTSVQVAMRRLRQSIFKILYLALGATAVLTLFFATTISRPLASLATRARRLAAGDRTVKLALNRRDEIGDLARVLENMAARLDARSHEVAELAANVSHELKSPLTSMRGAAELLLDGAADDPIARARFLRNIVFDVDRLDSLVTRMLELSRVRSDSESFVQTDLVELARAATIDLWAAGRVVVNSSHQHLAVCARPTHLMAAVRNLVDNAEEHGAEASPVVVEIARAGTRAVVSVANDGPPISERARERIWDRFYTTRGGEGGTGLGLPIVRAVAQAHGGVAALVSSDGRGTVFAIEIPISSA